MKGKLYLRGSFQTNGTGAIVPFHYHEIDIGEVYTKKEYPFCILLDITISVFSFQKIANIPIRVKRNIIASVFFNSHNNIEIEKKIYTLYSINGSALQTNIEEKNGKIFLKFAGPFSVKCFYSARAYYDITTTNNSFYEKPFLVNTFLSTIETMPPELEAGGGGGVTVHNDLTGRSDANTHPASSIANTPYGSITSTTVQDAINELADDIAAIPPPITVHNSLTGRDVLGSHPASAISYNPNVATGDIFSIDVQNAIQELGAVSGREARTGTITRNINDEITQVLINHSIAGYTTTTNITRNINGDITTIEKIYSNGTDTKTRTISITRDINNKITGWTVT